MKLKLTILFITFSVATIWSVDLPALEDVLFFLSTDDLTQLKTSGEFTAYHDDDIFNPTLVPMCKNSELIESNLTDRGLNIGIEGLFLDKTISSEKLNENYDQYMLAVYNILTDITTLEGLEYWSESRGKMRELFTDSWPIDDLKSKNKVAVKVYDTLPKQSVLYVHQKDTTFGKSESKISYYAESDSIYMSSVNQTNIRLAFVKVIDKGYMNLEILIVPTQEGLLYYGASAAKTIKNKLVQEKAGKSFYNRVVAINRWFTGYISELN